MSDFSPLKGRVLLKAGGVYKHADLAVREEIVYAKHGTGFVRLNSDHTTTKNKQWWDDLECEADIVSKYGRMVVRLPVALAAE